MGAILDENLAVKKIIQDDGNEISILDDNYALIETITKDDD